VRAIYVTLCGYVITAIPTTLATTLAAIWLESGRLGGTAAVFGFTALVGLAVAFCWTKEGAPAPRPPRDVRRRLADEERRIRLAANIERLEREAGLR
jgi:hypothetical protein